MRGSFEFAGAEPMPPRQARPATTGSGGARARPWRVSSPTGRSLGDHLCWPFRCRDELVTTARAYVTEGLSRHERVAYVSELDSADRHPELIGILDLDEHVERGELQFVSCDAMHGADAGDAADLPVLATLTEAALAAGYRGLRMFADETVRAHDPVQRMRQVSYEHHLDQFCCTHPVAALCAYDAAALGNSAVAELVSVHGMAQGDLSPFHVRASREADAALAGCIDVFCTDQFEQALQRIGVGEAGGTVTIDAVDLEFIDVRGLLTLDRYAAGSGATIVLRSAPAVVTRLCELVDLIALRVDDHR